MNHRLGPGEALDASALTIPLRPVPPAEVLDGSPSQGALRVSGSAGLVLGVWEITPGTVTDTETDETFVVIRGSATVRFTGSDLPALELRPGSVVRLESGQRTVWTVHETLRKVFILHDAV